MKKILALMLLAAAASAKADPALPSDPKGQVMLSWDKFNDLWASLVTMQKKIETLEKPVVPPPVPFALSGAAYRGTVLPGRASVEAVFSLEVLEPKEWVKVPFLPQSAAVTEATLDGRPIGLVRENGMHAALVRGAGRHVLRAALSLQAPKDEDAPELALPVPETPMTAVSLFFPRPHLEVAVADAQGQEVRAENGGTRVTAALAPTTSLRLRWHRALPTEKALPRKIYLDGEALFTVSEGALRGRWLLRYTVLHQAARELSLKLPEGWNVLNVSAEGLEEWKVDDEPRLSARFTYPRKGSIELVVEAERGLSEKEDLVPLPRLVPLDVERETGVIAVQAKGSVEVTVPESQGVQSLDPQELPPSVWGQAQQPVLYAFRHTGKAALSLSVTRHPDVPVLTTTVDLANALTLMTKRGETVTRVQYHVRNRVRQHLSLRLPDGAELWSAFVAGEPVKPTRLPDGAYRFPLRRTGAVADDVLVEVVYFARRHAFGWAGRRGAQLPLPDAPVSRALWSLYLPPEARPLSFGGDMDREENVAMPMSEPASFDVLKSIGGKISHALFKEKRDGARNEAAPAEALALQSRLLSDSLDARDDAPRREGVFPVYFQIPAEGALYHFGRAMIVGESPRVSFTYARGGLLTTLWYVMLMGLFAAVYRRRKELWSALSFFKRFSSRRDATA